MNIPDGPLYKYLGLNSASNPPWHERLRQLLEGRCYLASPASFNDPFDCLPTHYSPQTIDELKDWQERMIPALAEAVRGDIPAWFAEKQVREKLQEVPISELRKILHHASIKTANSIGVFCLAGRIDSVLMWSHYASNHTGIAIEFDFRDQLQCDLFPLWMVRYQLDRPMIRDLGSSNPELPLADALAIKADFWHYEEEWRAMKPDRAGTFAQFDPKIITGIVFGVNCSEVDEQLTRTICSGHDLEFRRMTTDDQTFSLALAPAQSE